MFVLPAIYKSFSPIPVTLCHDVAEVDAIRLRVVFRPCPPNALFLSSWRFLLPVPDPLLARSVRGLVAW